MYQSHSYANQSGFLFSRSHTIIFSYTFYFDLECSYTLRLALIMTLNSGILKHYYIIFVIENAHDFCLLFNLSELITFKPNMLGNEIFSTIQISRNITLTRTRWFVTIAQKRAWHLFCLRISQSTPRDVHSQVKQALRPLPRQLLSLKQTYKCERMWRCAWSVPYLVQIYLALWYRLQNKNILWDDIKGDRVWFVPTCPVFAGPVTFTDICYHHILWATLKPYLWMYFGKLTFLAHLVILM